MSTRLSKRVGVAGFAVATLLLSACGSGSPDATPESDGSGDSPDGGVSAEVIANVEKYKEVPTFTAPGEPIDVSSLEGKSMFLIPLVPNPFNQSIEETMEALADEVGMEYTVFPNQGEPSQWVQGMNAAITAQPDIIVLSTAPDPRVLQPQLQAAEDAGIPVLVTHFYDNSTPNPPDCEGCAAGVTAIVPAPFHDAAKAAADWIIVDSEAQANVLVIGSADILPSPGTVDVVTEELANACPECTSTVINIPVAQWNTDVQGEVQSALTRDPSITHVYPLYDAMVAGAVPAIQTVGRVDDVKVVSYNGSPYVLQYIQDGDIVGMDVGEDTVGIGYANMDQAFRILLGEPTVDQRTTIRIWDDTNVEETGTPPVVGQGYGDEAVVGFLQLWGLE